MVQRLPQLRRHQRHVGREFLGLLTLPQWHTLVGAGRALCGALLASDCVFGRSAVAARQRTDACRAAHRYASSLIALGAPVALPVLALHWLHLLLLYRRAAALRHGASTGTRLAAKRRIVVDSTSRCDLPSVWGSLRTRVKLH